MDKRSGRAIARHTRVLRVCGMARLGREVGHRSFACVGFANTGAPAVLIDELDAHNLYGIHAACLPSQINGRASS